MSRAPRRRGVGLGWWILLLTPPVIIVIALAALFIWQGSKGGVTPKWRSKPVPTNAAPDRPEQRQSPARSPGTPSSTTWTWHSLTRQRK